MTKGGIALKKAAYLLLAVFLLFAAPLFTWAEAKMVVTKTDRLNVREGPSTTYRVKTKLNKGQVYPAIQETNGWVQLRLTAKENGWVARQYVAEANVQMKATVDQLRVRSAPSAQAKIIGYLQREQIVQVIYRNGKWVKMKQNTLTGWVASDYLVSLSTDTTTSAAPPAQTVQTGTVAVDTLNVRAEPSLQANVIQKITFGQEVSIVGETSDWYQIKVNETVTGWVYRTYIMTASYSIKVLDDGTNIRTAPSLTANIQATANKGEQFRVIAKEGTWYKVKLPGQKSGYIAEWVVSIVRNNGGNGTIEKKTIVIDPGHGGKDSGTIGNGGIMEKMLTLQTALLLKNELQKTGANVYLTRTGDTYLTLQERVNIAHQYQADAFISIHYDSSLNGLASGMTAYYYDQQNDYPLALSLDPFFSQKLAIPYRGIRFGDFHVIRETNEPSVLLELGYVNNPTELAVIRSDAYQQQVVTAIVNGLNRYFSQ